MKVPYNSQDFYVYVLLRPNGVPCYVGKGHGDRYRFMYRYHNPHLRRIIANAGGSIESIKLRERLSEPQAFAFERALIAMLGRERFGGILVNDTDGGDGPSGYVPSEEQRAQWSANRKGRKRTAETNAKQSAIFKGRIMTPEHVAKIAKAHTGMKRSEEARANMRAAAALRWANPEEREIARRAQLGKKHPHRRKKPNPSLSSLEMFPGFLSG